MSSSEPPTDPRSLLGLSPVSGQLSCYLKDLAERLAVGEDALAPEIKAYPDALYLNYYAFGLSLMFIARDGSKNIKKDDAKSDKLVLDSIDIYNNLFSSKEPKSAGTSSTTYKNYPISELILPLEPSEKQKDRPKEVKITTLSSGKDLVAILGEPDRKGGGGGPSKGSIDIWCEWTKDGIMIEFGGEEAKGPKAWETGKDAKWKVLTLFRRNDSK